MPTLSQTRAGITTDALLAPWPHAVLDVPALRRAGHHPVPLRQFTLKVHSRCNLACSYCYIYNGSDESWRRHPPRVAPHIMRQTARRIAEHVREHELRAIRVDLHGGEPLLTGPDVLLEYVATIRAMVPDSCVVRVTVQTNGTLLTENVLAELAEADVHIGLSLDGGTSELNRRRLDHAGRPSWPTAVKAVELLGRHPETYAGLLCTIDIEQDPAQVYRSLVALLPPSLDLLLQHANWSAPPPGLPERAPEAARTGDRGPTPYGDWLAAVFDLWWDGVDATPRPPIRIFTEIVALLLGMPSVTETVGLSPVVAVVVETDGSIEQLDSLKQTYEGAVLTGLDVFRNSFDEVLDHPGAAARQMGAAALSVTCRSCPVVRVCGGGNYAHRYREGSGFRHPSVYCRDLERLFRHVAARLHAALAKTKGPPSG